jgi:SNF2 family DNA or RNA helicase
MEFLGVYPFDSPSMFNSRIANPVIKGTPNGLDTLRRLVHATSLRRTKDSIRGELHLPGREIVEEVIQLTQEEQRDYDVLKSSYASILHEDDETYISRRSTASIMQTIARLRQFCDHGLDLLPRRVLQLFGRFTTAEQLSWNIFDALEACAVCRIPINEDCQSQDPDNFGIFLC